MTFGLSAETVEMLRSLFSTHPEIECVKVFGSRALGNFRPNSDIDLVLWGSIDAKLHAKLCDELDELPLPYLFDVKIYAEVKHAGLREHIDSFAKVLYTLRV
jgi:predicted nucleotidyltransferase